MTGLVSLLFIAMIPIDFKTTKFSLRLYTRIYTSTVYYEVVNIQWQATMIRVLVCLHEYTYKATLYVNADSSLGISENVI